MKRNAKSEAGKLVFKLIVIGEAGVGKSCLINRFTKET